MSSNILKPIGDPKMSSLNQHFNICVTILEARNLAWPNMASVVCIQVGDNTKYTKIQRQSDRPFYNEVSVNIR